MTKLSLMLFNLLIIGCLILISSSSSGQWRYITKAENGIEFYYNTENIKRLTTPDDIVDVWVKRKVQKALLPKFRLDKISSRKKLGLSTRGYQSYIETIEHSQFNCTTRMSRRLSHYDYNVAGEILDQEVNNDSSVWEEIIPESVGVTVLRFLCSR